MNHMWCADLKPTFHIHRNKQQRWQQIILKLLIFIYTYTYKSYPILF